MDIPKNRFILNLAENFQKVKSCLFRKREGEKWIQERYLQLYGRKLNLENPQLFSEKLFHRMVMMHRKGCPRMTWLADKYRAREYVSATVGPQHLTNLLWHGSDPHKIPFDSLPAQSIAKTNHGSGCKIILEAPFDRDKIIAELSQSLKHNYYWKRRESQYYNIPPKIVIEELLNDGYSDGPLDYRWWCFNGKPEMVQMDNRGYTLHTFYDSNWERVPIFYQKNDYDREREVPKPANLEEMLWVAGALSAGFGFVRVDLYNVSGRIYFGEVTFTPTAGTLMLQPSQWDAKLGALWTLDESY